MELRIKALRIQLVESLLIISNILTEYCARNSKFRLKLFTNTIDGMLIKIFILLFIIVNVSVCDCCNSNNFKVKHETASWSLLRLRSGESKQCQFINDEFHKLKGLWYYILRTIASKNTSTIHCGRFTVTETSQDGFESTLLYLTDDGELNGVPITAKFVNETVAEILELNKLITGKPEWKFPFTVQIGICDNNTLLIVEPIHYHGGGMVFSREIPDSVAGLKLRFGTYNEDRGKESTVGIDFNCTSKYSDYYSLNDSGLLENSTLWKNVLD